jgi:hypothetical protein
LNCDRVRSLRCFDSRVNAPARSGHVSGTERLFALAILYCKCIILPRQARDQHRKKPEKINAPPRSCHACQPDSAPKTGCCCYPGCDQGKCSSFKFERNIVYQPQNATGIFVGTGFAGARTSTLFGTILRQTIVKADLLLVTKTGSGQTNKQNGNLTKEGRRFDSRSCAEGLDNFTFGKNLYWDGNASAR